MVEIIRNQYKPKMICEKAVNNYPFAQDSPPNYYMIQELCEKLVDTYPLLYNLPLTGIRLKIRVRKLLILVILY